MISHSVISGTGFIKCMPMTCSGRLVLLKSSVIEIDDVLVASTAPGLAAASIFSKIFCFSSWFSVAASTMKSHSASAS